MYAFACVCEGGCECCKIASFCPFLSFFVLRAREYYNVSLFSFAFLSLKKYAIKHI